MGDSTARAGKEQDDPEHHAALQSKEVPKGQRTQEAAQSSSYWINLQQFEYQNK